jgi:hypothetical protein
MGGWVFSCWVLGFSCCTYFVLGRLHCVLVTVGLGLGLISFIGFVCISCFMFVCVFIVRVQV